MQMERLKDDSPNESLRMGSVLPVPLSRSRCPVVAFPLSRCPGPVVPLSRWPSPLAVRELQLGEPLHFEGILVKMRFDRQKLW